ncbi:MAG TPA: hypothetical protein PK876_08520 [Elusimicrobiota bacterium]|nr:hypothetical protein [Elusimicrobiota bacterium]
MSIKRTVLTAGIFFMAFLFSAQAISTVFFTPRWPLFGAPSMQDNALLDVSGVFIGARRFAADLAFIQLLQYYGSEETEHEEGEADSLAAGVSLSFYPHLLTYARRSVGLDPYFHDVYLFAAGALAFNLNRAEEALSLLAEGKKADPTFWRYQLYAGAIAFRKSFQMDKVIELLEEAIQYPDCPPLLENILGNLHKKKGNYARAAQIFRHILETSRDQGYLDAARRQLETLRSMGYTA